MGDGRSIDIIGDRWVAGGEKVKLREAHFVI